MSKLGAAGVINAIEGPGNAQYIDPRFACGKAPCFMVGGQDAWFLQTVIGKAANAGVLDKLKITLALTSEEQSGLTSANGIATIPGKSARRIIINAHADGYFQGGDDNASGLAVLVGLAKYFAKQPQPKHTLMFVASGGHHGPGNGPTSLVAAHPELKDGTVLILNLEHVAYADVVRGKVARGEQHRHDVGDQRDGEREGGRRHQRVAVPVRPLEAGVALLRRRDVSVGRHDRVRRPRRLPAARTCR